MKTTGTGTVLPPGTIDAKHALATGPVEVLIEAVHPENGYDAEGDPVPSDHLEATCAYPGGFVKGHQVDSMEDLLPKVIGQLRGRYGVAEVAVTKAPKELKAGGTIIMEVSNGQ